MTTVLIADDHVLFREGLEALIERWPDFAVVGSAEDGAEAVEKARRLRPNLVLMDVRMPGIGGLEATRLITAADPNVRVVMLTMSNLGDDVLQALRNGAHGYLSKDEPVERL
ncbi:MAG: response regulator transcription factor, partial [Bifidobacteriaceae bacterium]|nr:response regulator transcription factor [Bifidobacteriaceae bacterium]